MRLAVPASLLLGLLIVTALPADEVSDKARELEKAGDPQARMERARLLELSGRLEEALEAYQLIPEIPEARYRAGLIHREMGSLAEAEQAWRALLNAAPEASLRARTLTALAGILHQTGRREEAEKTYSLLLSQPPDPACIPCMPAALLGYLELLLAEDRKKEAEEIGERLKREYPGSPETALARRLLGAGEPAQVSYLESPSRLLGAPEGSAPPTQGAGMEAPPSQPGPQELTTARIQVGSFQVLENARYLIRDLEKRGFTASVLEHERQGTTYYRALVDANPGEDAQQLLLRLKDAGFEGILYIPES